MGGWMEIAVRKRVVTPDKIENLLEEIRTHGIMDLACIRANLSKAVINRYVDENPEFEEALQDARNTYKARVLLHHQDLVFNGTEKVNYDRNGNIISTEKVFMPRLIELELKKVDSEYRDKQEVTHKVAGGVLVAPSDVGSVEEWEEKYKSSPMVDITPEKEDEKKP
jgi:hypothetical protein